MKKLLLLSILTVSAGLSAATVQQAKQFCSNRRVYDNFAEAVMWDTRTANEREQDAIANCVQFYSVTGRVLTSPGLEL